MTRCSSDDGRQVVVFDLDDTLYKEIDFLESAYRAIADRLLDEGRLGEDPYPMMRELYARGENVFGVLEREYGMPVATALALYRNHRPRIVLSPGVEALLRELKERGSLIGLVTDGRSVAQRNKIEALGLRAYLAPGAVVISEEFGSEKPDEANFVHFVRMYPRRRFTYVGDNPRKDFLAPNRLGWRTVCLRDDGRNIHPQSFDLPTEYLPQTIVETTDQIIYHI